MFNLLTGFVRSLDRLGFINAVVITSSSAASMCLGAADGTRTLDLLGAMLTNEECGLHQYLRHVGVDVGSIASQARDRSASSTEARRAVLDAVRSAFDVVPVKSDGRLRQNGREYLSRELHTIHMLWGLLKARSGTASGLLRSKLEGVMVRKRSTIWTSWYDAS